jgi:hypothetical protein
MTSGKETGSFYKKFFGLAIHVQLIFGYEVTESIIVRA